MCAGSEPTLLVHGLVHASWLNQVETYFSTTQRELLTPNDCTELEAVRLRLALYEELSNRSLTPFQWKFDRARMAARLARMQAAAGTLGSTATNGVP
jgi:hypothetical protein